MDKPPLSLKLPKKSRDNKKERDLILKQKRNYKKKLQNKGQLLLEGLFFTIILLAFLSTIQFFQYVAEKEIQKSKLTEKKDDKIKKPSWFKTKNEEY